MRISDWSSDVCSSDLVRRVRRGTMKTRSGWRLRALGALAVAAGLAAAVPAAADDWNIVGLRFGRSVEETKAALKAYDPAITLDEHWQYFAYSEDRQRTRLNSSH